MGKYERKRERKREQRFPKWILVFFLMALVVFLILFVMPVMLYHLNTDHDLDSTTPSTTFQNQEAETQASIEAPVPTDTQIPTASVAPTETQPTAESTAPTETQLPQSDDPTTPPAAAHVPFPVKLVEGNI